MSIWNDGFVKGNGLVGFIWSSVVLICVFFLFGGYFGGGDVCGGVISLLNIWSVLLEMVFLGMCYIVRRDWGGYSRMDVGINFLVGWSYRWYFFFIYFYLIWVLLKFGLIFWL